MAANDLKYWYLRNHKLFSTLNNSQIKDLCIITKYKEASKGDVIYFPDDETKRIYFLKKGMIKIINQDAEGKETIKDIIRQGDLFGELLLDEENNSGELALAMSKNVSICSFRISDFEAVLERNPSLALKFFKLVGYKFRRIENRYENLLFKDVKQRLLSFLNDWADAEGQQSNGRMIIANYLTHQDIADMICSTRQTVTQLLNELEQQNILHYSRKEIILAIRQ